MKLFVASHFQYNDKTIAPIFHHYERSRITQTTRISLTSGRRIIHPLDDSNRSVGHVLAEDVTMSKHSHRRGLR